tara:strand:- start:2513 stop:2941 length:429 start_codon:yes stop_codon:yes gene_type:complete
MGKVLLNQFTKKLAEKNSKNNYLGKSSIKIDVNDFQNKKSQIFISYLSKYLTNESIRKSIVKINNYTIKYKAFSKNNSYGTQSVYYLTLSLIELDKKSVEKWECVLFECDDIDENEVESNFFNNGKSAIEHFMNQIVNLCNG